MMDGRLLNERENVTLWDKFFWILTALAAVLLCFSVYFRTTYMLVEVKGKSMYATLADGDELFAKKNDRADRGDIVVIDVRESEYAFSGDYIIKRVIATGGDEIYCREHTVYIRYAGTESFVALEENYVSDRAGNHDFDTVKVPSGYVFAMGDNRSNSMDSRVAGCFPSSTVTAVVTDWAYENKAWIGLWFGGRV